MLQQCRLDLAEKAVVVHGVAEPHAYELGADMTGERFNSHDAFL